MTWNKAINELPEIIRNHILRIAEEQDRGKDDDYVGSLAFVWRKKEELFRKQIGAVKLELTEKVSLKDSRGMMILTYSGSILCVGPVFPTTTNLNLGRWIEYSSIKLRTEVPDIIMDKGVSLAADLSEGNPVSLAGSKVKTTSPAYLIAVCPPELDEEEQDKRVRESAIFITAGFMKYNQSLAIDPGSVPDQFTMKSMTRFLAKKHGLTGQEAKLILEDFITLIETGMLMGESVPIGRLGKFSIKTRDAQKPRIVRHPATGEEMTVEAKPARGVPKISFSSYLKEKAEGVVGD